MLGIFLRKIKDFPGENPDSLSPEPFSDPENLQFSQLENLLEYLTTYNTYSGHIPCKIFQ
jgi:hypothetical protein